MARVELKNAYKQYGKDQAPAVDGIDLAIGEGDFVVLLGPSGCGKTTTLRMIAGLETLTRGELWFDDRVVNDDPPDRRNVGMVFQNYALYPHMTVDQNLSFGLKAARTPKAEIRRRVAEVTALLGLDAYLGRRPKELSGGQRQRVALGRALMRRPAVFLMDEPLSNLDAHLRAEMRGEILKLHRRLGATFIFVTHDQIEALTMGDRIAVMAEGKILQVGSPDELYLRPANRFVAGFIGAPAMGFVTCDVASASETVVLRNPSADIYLSPARAAVVARRATGAVSVGLRPDYLRLVRADEPPTMGTVLRGVVEVVEPLGADQHVLVRIGDAAITAKLPRSDRVQIDDKVTLTVSDEAGIHVFDAESGVACS